PSRGRGAKKQPRLPKRPATAAPPRSATHPSRRQARPHLTVPPSPQPPTGRGGAARPLFARTVLVADTGNLPPRRRGQGVAGAWHQGDRLPTPRHTGRPRA